MNEIRQFQICSNKHETPLVASTGRVCLWFCGVVFYVKEYPQAQPSVFLVLKASQRTGPRLKVSSDRLGEARNQTFVIKA